MAEPITAQGRTGTTRADGFRGPADHLDGGVEAGVGLDAADGTQERAQAVAPIASFSSSFDIDDVRSMPSSLAISCISAFVDCESTSMPA